MASPEIDPLKVNPGFHKLFQINTFPRNEQLILTRMSKEWYITNSGEEFHLGISKFRFVLIKPTQVFSEMFNVDREIICIFSPYENFEPRTLDAFDYAVSKFPALRVESVCRVLISMDSNVEEKISALLKSDPELPIVIPFNYSELSLPYNDYFFRNRFRKHFYTRDLFSFLSPLKKDLYFFGRSELIQDIVSRHKSGEHSALFGLRKSGKTSIVFAIERFMASHNGKTITVDCENPSVHKLRWNELLYHLVELFRDKLSPITLIEQLESYTDKQAAELFEIDMLAIYNNNSQPVLLIFDEIERISPRTGSSDHWRNEDDFVYFWQTLRYFFQKHPEMFTYMLVGTNPFCVETPTLGKHDNPLFSSIPFQYVPSFDIPKTREMVRKLGRYMGMKFDEIIYSKLTEDFGGHPFLIRQMCSVINSLCSQERPAHVDKALYERAKSKFLMNSKHYIEMIVQVLKEWYQDEYDMLVLLANNDRTIFDDVASAKNYYANHLCGYGLINMGSNGYCFNIEIVKQYLIERNKYEKNSLSHEQRLAEVSERRRNLEKSLRKIIRNQLKSTFGKKVAVQKVLCSLQENRREQLSNMDIDLILNPDNSPLYFLELSLILKREWEHFKNIFDLDKDKLIMMLEEINSMRKDAHSNNMSDDDFQQMRIYFNKLENILQDW